MIDLNTMFANAAISYRTMAARCEERAREEEAALNSPWGRVAGAEDWVGATAARHRSEGQHWTRMALAADRGRHLIEPNPVGPALELFPELAAEAARQKRVITTLPVGLVESAEEPIVAGRV